MSRSAPPRLYLASRSPRRRLLLAQLCLDFECLDLAIPEAQRDFEGAETYVARMAVEKAERGASRVANRGRSAILGADTVVVLDGEVIGKPRDPDDALLGLRRLSGRAHHVLSAVALTTGRTEVRLSETTVWFRALEVAECRAYCATREPLGKAGGYAIQGLAAAFIERIDGSYSGVMGLPLFETAQLLRAAGVEVLPGAPR